jgi:hypothetical protein
MMDFSESPLKVLADDIADAKTNGGLYKWEVKFKLKDTSPVDLTDEKLVYTDEEKDGFFEPLSLMNLDIVSNYLDRNSDQFNFVLVVSPGMWVHIILPSRDHCMIHLTRTKLAALGGVEDDTQNVQTWVLKPIFNVPEELSQNFVPVEVNILKDGWNKKFRAFATPTFYILDKNENKIGRQLIGETSEDELLKALKALKK